MQHWSFRCGANVTEYINTNLESIEPQLDLVLDEVKGHDVRSNCQLYIVGIMWNIAVSENEMLL